jgi:hypothetical protein
MASTIDEQGSLNRSYVKKNTEITKIFKYHNKKQIFEIEKEE